MGTVGLPPQKALGGCEIAQIALMGCEPLCLAAPMALPQTTGVEER